jgi:AraC-like DNA-binding protein
MLLLDHHGCEGRAAGAAFRLQVRHRQPRGAWLVKAIISGSLVVSLRGRDVVVRAGEAFALRFGGDGGYGLGPAAPGPARFRWVVLRGPELDPLLVPALERGGRLTTTPDPAATLQRLIDGASRERVADARQAALAIYAGLLDLLPGDAVADPRAGVDDAIRQLHANPTHPWSLETLARSCGCTRDHLTRTFAARHGQTPARWLARHRLDAARNLLRHSRLSVATIATQCGSGSAHALARHLRQETGHGPQGYRDSGAS